MKLIIKKEVFDKVMYWIDRADFEVSGLGTIEIDKDGNPVVTDAWLLDQVGQATETDLKAEDINRLEYELYQKGIKSGLRWWWHSHVNMSAFWSGTDDKTIRELGEHGWFMHTVLNKKREYLSAMSCPYQLECPLYPGVHTYVIDKFPTEIESVMDPRAAEWEEAYATKVKRKTYESVSGGFLERGNSGNERSAAVVSLASSDAKKEESGKAVNKKGERHNNAFLSKNDTLAEIESCLYWGWDDDEIEREFAPEIKMYTIDVKQERRDYMDLIGYGYTREQGGAWSC